MIQKLKGLFQRFKTPNEPKPDWIGIGVAKWWGLREDHRFFIAAAHHDASQDAIDVFEGSKTLDECAKDPFYYQDIVTSKLNELTIFVESRPHLSKGELIIMWVGIEDRAFYGMTTRLVRKRFAKLDKLQGFLFYKIVKSYSYFKYRNNNNDD